MRQDIGERAAILLKPHKKSIFCIEAMWARFFHALYDVNQRIDVGEMDDV
jgi:hypothetical protein